MNAFLLLAAATPTPSPSGTPQAVGSGSPGFLGFVFTFLLAIAAVFLFLSLTRHLRIVDRRSKQRDEEEGVAEGDDPPYRGPLDVGAAGVDLEVDADVDVAFDDFLPDQRRTGDDDEPGAQGTGRA